MYELEVTALHAVDWAMAYLRNFYWSISFSILVIYLGSVIVVQSSVEIRDFLSQGLYKIYSVKITWYLFLIHQQLTLLALLLTFLVMFINLFENFL